MGFYGRHYTYTVNDYFKSFKFQNTITRGTTEVKFPGTANPALSAGEMKTLTATTPGETINIATGNKWIQFVVTSESADMNSPQTVATGLTLYHKKADKLTQGKIVDFSNAVMMDGENELKEGTSLILGYGKPVSVNDVTFDEAGHANGSEQSTISYTLPKVIQYYDSGNNTRPGYVQAYNLQDKIANEANFQQYELELNSLIRDYPFSASAIIKPMYDNTKQIENHHTILHEGNDEVGHPGLIGQAKNLDSRVTEVETQIEEDILPALNLVPGIGKPGIEIDKTSKEITYSSFLGSAISYQAGDKGTAFNHYDLTSLEIYDEVTFSDSVVYVPNKYYDENHELAKEAAPIEGKKYYSKRWGNNLKNTNYVLGDYSLATGYGTRALGKCAQAGNGYYGSNTVHYITTAYGNSSHSEGRSDLKSQKLLMGANTVCDSGAIHADLDYTGMWNDADPTNGPSRRQKRVYIGLEVESNGVQKYKIYPAQDNNSGMINISQETLNGDKILGTPSNTYYEIYSGLAFGEASHSEGLGTVAEGKASHSEGWGTIAIGDYSHAEGNATFAMGIGSHAEGLLTTASGDNSHVEGQSTTASGDNSHAEGQSTVASGNNSHAEGVASDTTEPTTASGIGSHAEGQGTQALGDYSHAEGAKFTTKRVEAKGTASHAQGGGCVASKDYSHAGGVLSESTGTGSIAQGYGVVSSSLDGSAAFGKFNTKYTAGAENLPMFAVGNGTSETDRKDIFTVWSNGNCEMYGSVRIHGRALYLLDEADKAWKITVSTSGQLIATADTTQ